MGSRSKLIAGIAVSGTLVAVGLAAPGIASGHPSKAAKATVHLRKLSIGKVLVNSKSRTIYLFSKDTHGKSHCSRSCQAYWPPVTSKKKAVAGTGIVKKHLGRIAKTHQVTYYGHPLYTYLVDTKAGQDHGEAFSDFGAKWYVVSAKGAAIKPKKTTKPVGGGGGTPTPTPTTSSSPPPPYIPAAPTSAAEVTTGTVNSMTLLQNAADNHTLYYLTGDKHPDGTFSCTSTCQQVWIPLLTDGAPTAGGSAATPSTVIRPDDSNEVQVTYNNYPVYEYVGDTTSTTAKGNLVHADGGTWYDIGIV